MREPEEWERCQIEYADRCDITLSALIEGRPAGILSTKIVNFLMDKQNGIRSEVRKWKEKMDL
jgi:hypothetical protein